MEPHEILPKPEIKNSSDTLERVDGFDEAAADKALESKQGSSKGSTAISGVAVDDASNQVTASRAASILGGAATSGVQIDTPDIADDIDLIEKAWVLKAKEIVMRTQGDPYSQNKHLSNVKVDYIKKRYGKQIRTGEER
jgi:hypothetical protein